MKGRSRLHFNLVSALQRSLKQSLVCISGSPCSSHRYFLHPHHCICSHPSSSNYQLQQSHHFTWLISMWANWISCTHLQQPPNWPGLSKELREHLGSNSHWWCYVNSYCQEKRHNKQPVPSTERCLEDKHLVQRLNDSSGMNSLIQDVQHRPEFPPSQHNSELHLSPAALETLFPPPQNRLETWRLENPTTAEMGWVSSHSETNQILNFLNLYVFRCCYA